MGSSTETSNATIKTLCAGMDVTGALWKMDGDVWGTYAPE